MKGCFDYCTRRSYDMYVCKLDNSPDKEKKKPQITLLGFWNLVFSEAVGWRHDKDQCMEKSDSEIFEDDGY